MPPKIKSVKKEMPAIATNRVIPVPSASLRNVDLNMLPVLKTKRAEPSKRLPMTSPDHHASQASLKGTCSACPKLRLVTPMVALKRVLKKTPRNRNPKTSLRRSIEG